MSGQEEGKMQHNVIVDAFEIIASTRAYQGCWLLDCDVCRLICHEFCLPNNIGIDYSCLNTSLIKDHRYKNALNRLKDLECGGVFSDLVQTVPPNEKKRRKAKCYFLAAENEYLPKYTSEWYNHIKQITIDKESATSPRHCGGHALWSKTREALLSVLPATASKIAAKGKKVVKTPTAKSAVATPERKVAAKIDSPMTMALKAKFPRKSSDIVEARKRKEHPKWKELDQSFTVSEWQLRDSVNNLTWWLLAQCQHRSAQHNCFGMHLHKD